jgi:ParB family transcriptional regulator, chromosome partitioning protein
MNMADVVTLVNPDKLERNDDNPRLIFRQEDLDALQQSIASQGILVPLTVFKEGRGYRLLDGERRWRCAIKLGLSQVPVIVQPKPERLQNIMMMFAIHHARKDWDPLPTAMKLQDLEDEFTKRNSRKPNEKELAGLASLSRGEVRRLKKLLGLPKSYRDDLLKELDKPRAEQVLTVDHVLEATTAASLLRKRGIVDDDRAEDQLRKAIIGKFRTKVINNTVAPRKLARMARAVERNELPLASAKQVIKKLIDIPNYDIDSAFRDSVEQVDFEHNIEQHIDRLASALDEHRRRRYKLSDTLTRKLESLEVAIRKIISQG